MSPANMLTCMACSHEREGSREPWIRMVRQENWYTATIGHICEPCAKTVIAAMKRARTVVST